MDWDDVRHFLALARMGSVRAAGTSLGVSHSTVARRVEALEEELSVRLFDRDRDGYALSEAGRQMLPAAERIESEMSALERGLVGQDERLAGSVSLTCCDNYVAEIVLSGLVGLCEEHPEIDLTFNTDSRPFNLSKREADIAIRTLAKDASPPEHLIGHRLAPVTTANYVCAAHADRLDPELVRSNTRWIAFEPRKHQEQMIAESSYPSVPAWGAFSSLELMVQAACEGLGVVMLPTYVGDSEPTLRRLAQPDLRHVADLWLLSHPDLRNNARLKATRARIAEAIKAKAPLFRGEG